MRNAEVAAVLYDISELLEIKGEKHIQQSRAYAKAARAIEGLTEDIEEIASGKANGNTGRRGIHCRKNRGVPENRQNRAVRGVVEAGARGAS